MIGTFESGLGYVHAVALKTDSHFDILDISESLVESRALTLCEENDKKAIVASIAKMTMTTISSTRVKAESFSYDLR